MKRILLFLCFASFCFFSCKKNNSGGTHPEQGLLLYLPFNGDFTDSSGNANPIASSGSPSLTTDAQGHANSAFGGGGRIIVTNNGSIRFDTAFTLSFDLMINTPGRYGMVEFVDNSNGLSYVLGFGTTAASPHNLQFVTSISPVNSCGSQTNIIGDTTAFVPQTGVWYNVIGIYNKGTLTTYINGQVKSTVSGGTPTVSICPSARIVIGGWWDGDPALVIGKMDEVRLYNRVLTNSEIIQLSAGF